MRLKLRIRWVLAILLLYGLCHTEAFAYGYNNNAQSNAWGYQPVYKAGTSSAPTYQFQSTSSYAPSGRVRVFAPGATSPSFSPRRNDSWDDPDEGWEIGVVDDPTPVGDIPWIFMFLLIGGYFAYARKKIC